MVIFHSHVSLPEGNNSIEVMNFRHFPTIFPVPGAPGARLAILTHHRHGRPLLGLHSTGAADDVEMGKREDMNQMVSNFDLLVGGLPTF
jgi:hypothetical protein